MMAVNIPIMCTAIAQAVLSIVILAHCSRHWYSTISAIADTDIAHIPVLFAMRALPTIFLLICGIFGFATSFFSNSVLVTMYNTITMHTGCCLIFIAWFFTYHVLFDDFQLDIDCSKRCVGLVVASVVVCIVYLTYTSIRTYIQRHNPVQEQVSLEDESSSGTSCTEPDVTVKY